MKEMAIYEIYERPLKRNKQDKKKSNGKGENN